MKKHPYYSYAKVLSFNAVYNFIMGGRGLGKTYGAKKKVIKDALTKGHQFIYLRRYKTELTVSRNTFFADVQNEFKSHDFRVNGNIAQAAPIETREDKKREWQTIGYFISLSTAQTQKSVAFPKVRTIIFDEFILEKGALQYLPDEAIVFNNFYSTVDRYQDKTRVFFLANAVSIMNPYFIEYEIRPDQVEGKEIFSLFDNFMVCHFPNAEDFSESVYETKFGKFIKNTEYAEYAVGNQFSDNTDAMLAAKDPRARYQFTLETKRGSFSIWANLITGEYYAQSKLPKSQEIFTLLPERMDADKTLMRFADRPLAGLRTAFARGHVSFDKPSTRNMFADIFKR